MANLEVRVGSPRRYAGRVRPAGGRGPGVRNPLTHTGMGAVSAGDYEPFPDEAAAQAQLDRERAEAADELERLRIVAPVVGDLVETIIHEGASFARSQFGNSVSQEQFEQAARLASILAGSRQASPFSSPIVLALLIGGGLYLATRKG